MRKICISLFFMVLLTSTGASAFNGLRKGFVLGGGLGFGPVAKVSVDNVDLDNSGLALNFLIGYGWDEQNMVVFLRDAML